MKSYLRSLDPTSLRGKNAVFVACDRVEPYVGYIREKCPALFETGDTRVEASPAL
jgi:hypothetical protein